MKKIILIISALIFITAVFYFFIRLEIFTSSIKYLVQAELTKLTGRKAKIEKVVWIPFNKLILKNVSFYGFSCTETVIDINLKKINRGIGSIEKIVLNDTQIDYPKIEEVFKKTKSSSKSKVGLPLVNISVNRGIINFENFDINNIYIEVVPNNEIFAFKLDFLAGDKNKFTGGVKLAGTVNRDFSDVKLKGELKNIIFKKLEPLNGTLNIKGNKDILYLNSDISSGEAKIKIKSNMIPREKQFRFHTFGTINNLQNLTKLLGYTTTQYTVEGPLSFNGYFELPDSRLNLHLNQLYMKTYSGIDIKNIKTNLIYEDKKWLITSTATVLGGTTFVDGKIQNNNLYFKLYSNNMSIESKYTSGMLSLNANISGDISKPIVSGKVNINKFLLKNGSIDNIYGDFNWENNRGKLRLRGKNTFVEVDANKTEISNCKIRHDTMNITVSGKYNKMEFSAKNIDTSLIDKRFYGFIDCKGNLINIFSSQPVLNAKFSSQQIMVNDNSAPLSGELIYSNKSIHIKDLNIDGMSGNIKILSDKKETSGNLNLTKCNSDFILPFIGIKPEILSGTISGKINWDGSLKNPKPYGTIIMTRGNILKDIPYELIVTSFETKSTKFIITEFALQQKASKTSLKMSGEIEKNYFRFSLKLDELDIQNRIINGDFTINGKKLGDEVSYKITSPNLMVDKMAEKFLATGVFDGQKIDFKEITWGDKIKGSFNYLLENKYVVSNIKFYLNTGEFSEKIKGKLTGNISIKGHINEPHILVNYKYNGSINSMDSEGTGKISIKQKQLKMEDTKFFIDKANVIISGTADLEKKEFTGLNITAKNLRMASIYTLYGSTFPLSGKLDNIDFNITDSFKDPQILVNFNGTNMHLKNQILDFVEGKVKLKDKQISFSKGNIKLGEMQIKILPESNISFHKETIFKIKTELRNVKLPGVVLFGGVDIEGVYDNSVKADVSISNLWINQYQLKNAKYYFEYSNNVLSFIPEMGKSAQITGNIDFSVPSEIKISNFAIFTGGNKLLDINGILKDNNFELISDGADISLGNLLNILNLKVTATGNTNFNVRVSGTKGNPILTCMLNSSEGKVENIDFDIASIFFQYNENILELKQLKISRKNIYSIEGEGTIPLPLNEEMKKKLHERPIDISLKIKDGDMEILTVLSKKVKKAKGTFSMYVDIKGNLNKPDISGELKASAEEIVMKDIFKKINDFRCNIKFSGNKIELGEVSALIDKEPLVLSGYFSIKEIFSLDYFNLHLRTPNKNVPVTINDLQIKTGGIGKLIPGVPETSFANPSRAKIDCDTKFEGTPESWNIDGFIKLSDSRVTYPGIESEEEGNWDFLKNANWNFKIIAGKNCWYENDFANVEVKGELLLHNKGVSPLVSGKVEALNGEIDYLGRNFAIKEALLEAEESNLYLSGIAEAETEIEKRTEDPVTHQMITEYIPDTIILTIERGPLENVKPKFSSKTSLQTDEKSAAQAAMGLADTRQKHPFSAEEITRAVDTLLTTPFVKSFLRRTGFIDRFAIKRETHATSASDGEQPSLIDLYRGTKLQFGKSFARGFSAEYGVKFDYENKLSLKHDIELSYRFRSGLIFKTVQGLDGEKDRKFFFEKYWRFGTEPQKETSK